MSSYVIDKRNYMMMGGALAGLAEIKNEYREPALRVWHYGENRVYNAEDYRKAADWLYYLNSVSVAWQYHDEEREKDAETYKADFERARARAKAIYIRGGAELNNLCYDLQNFFSAVLYQIEEPTSEQKAKGFIYRVCFSIFAMMGRKNGSEDKCWSHFEL